jgi:hypothetical protein
LQHSALSQQYKKPAFAQVRKRIFILRRFIPKMHHFTKTGSGQTLEKHSKQGGFLAQWKSPTYKSASQLDPSSSGSGHVVDTLVRKTHLFCDPISC